MALPIDIVLVRHGQSEGNAIRRLSEAGDHSAFTDALKNKHSASLRLTELGRRQASLAGAFLREEFFKNSEGFGRYIVSEYARAMETAALLQLPNARWFCDFYLVERDWGELDICSEEEREKKFGASLHLRKVEPFFWRPPGGETFAELCLRIDRVLYTLHRECSEKRVLIVCHGEVMWAFMLRIERMSQTRFRELYSSRKNGDRIFTCQIIHYTRRDPSDDTRVTPYVNWVRFIRPTEEPMIKSGWRIINRPSYTNAELLEIAERAPTMLR